MGVDLEMVAEFVEVIVMTVEELKDEVLDFYLGLFGGQCLRDGEFKAFPAFRGEFLENPLDRGLHG